MIHAAGIALNAPGHGLLLMRRKDNGKWSYPAGMIEGDETPEECARREFAEETGRSYSGRLEYQGYKAKDGLVFHTFKGMVDKPFDPTPCEEHDAYAWIGPAQAVGRTVGSFNDGVMEMIMAADKALATDPPVSEKQRRAMYAAAAGKSTIGIPASVGKEFVGDAEVSVTEPNVSVPLAKPKKTGVAKPSTDCLGMVKDGNPAVLQELMRAWMAWFHEEAASERWNRFAADGCAMDMTDEDWSGLLDGFKKFIAEEKREAEHAEDTALSFDLQSVRAYSKDGHLHVEECNISKGNVCPYYGREIPGMHGLHLEENKLYYLYRDPDELSKAAATFNNLPLLSKHVAIDSSSHPPELVIGSTGTDAHYQHPYLRNSLVVWPQEAIHAIETDQQKELSCAYHYRADMTPGETPEGVRYDGVMRDIIGNHVALVVEGRAGSDVVVGDALPSGLRPQLHQGEVVMTKKLVSRTALLLQGAILGSLRPLLAADAQVDITPLLDGVTAKNVGERKKVIYDGLVTATTGKLAKDAKLDGVMIALDAAEKEASAEDDFPPKDKKEGEDEEEDDKDKKAKDEEEAKKAMDAKLSTMVTKDDMAVAIRVATDAAVKNQQAIRSAHNAVRPWVGDLALDAANPDDVYKEALKVLNVDVSGVHPSAFKTILGLQPKPGSGHGGNGQVALDQAAADSFATMFPEAARLL